MQPSAVAVNKAGIAMSLYDKRGRNNTGKVMFNGHQGGNGGSDMNAGSQNSMGYHQRNQT